MGELVRPHGEDATLDTVIERPPTPLSHLLTATKLRRIADLMDELDRDRGAVGDDAIQRDLRAWADGLETGAIS